MIENILELSIGSKKVTAVVKDVNLISILKDNKEVEQKIVLNVLDTTTKKEYNVSDAYVDYKGKVIIRALWFYESPDGIYAKSTLAQIMNFYDVQNLKELIGKTVFLFPDKNEFLTLIATNNSI